MHFPSSSSCNASITTALHRHVGNLRRSRLLVLPPSMLIDTSVLAGPMTGLKVPLAMAAGISSFHMRIICTRVGVVRAWMLSARSTHLVVLGAVHLPLDVLLGVWIVHHKGATLDVKCIAQRVQVPQVGDLIAEKPSKPLVVAWQALAQCQHIWLILWLRSREHLLDTLQHGVPLGSRLTGGPWRRTQHGTAHSCCTSAPGRCRRGGEA